MDEEQNDQGYYSNGQIVPFFDRVYDEAPLRIGNKEEVGIGDPKQAIDIPPPASDLTHNDINKMKVVQTKEELNVGQKQHHRHIFRYGLLQLLKW